MATNEDDLSGIQDFDFSSILGTGTDTPAGDVPPPAAQSPTPAAQAADAEDDSSDLDDVDAIAQPAPSTNDRLAAALEKLAAVQATPAPAAPAPAKTPEEKAFQFMLTQQSVPADLMAKLTSEDRQEQMQGLLALVSGVANMVRQRVRTEITEEYQPQFRSLVQDHVAQQARQQEMIADFRSSFPVLANHPEGQVIGRLLSERAIKAMQAAGRPESEMSYGPVFKKYLAAELKKVAVTKTPGAAQPAPRKAPTQMSRQGAPREGTPGMTSLSDEIWNVVN